MLWHGAQCARGGVLVTPPGVTAARFPPLANPDVNPLQDHVHFHSEILKLRRRDCYGVTLLHVAARHCTAIAQERYAHGRPKAASYTWRY